jgi:hypothetical protein
MFIALHGGLTGEMLFSIIGSYIFTAIYLIYAHYRTYKTKYYSEEYIYFSTGKKVIMYLGFILVNLVFAYLLFWLFTFVLLYLFT